MRRFPLFLLLLVFATACSGSDGTTDPETTTTATTVPSTEQADGGTPPALSIAIAGFRFSGDESGSVGDAVQVTNSDNVSHTWTSTDGAFHSGTLGSGETFTYTFEEAGTFPYFCQIHPEMSGTITIDG